eukprot:symbB.v1.2.030289.t1/scaffold3398.1/size57691/3
MGLCVTLLASAAADVSIPWEEGCSLRDSFDLSSSCGKPPALELIQDCGSQGHTACMKKRVKNQVLLTKSRKIESLQELSSFLQETASASCSGWGSKASAAADSIQQSSSSEYSLSFMSLMLGLAEEETIENIQKLRLTFPAQKMLLDNPKGFLDVYGSRFVGSILSGYEFGGVCSLTAKSHTANKSFEAFASFQAAGIFSASGSFHFQSKFNEFRSTLDLRCNARFKGGEDVPIGPYQTPADLVEAIEKWGKTRTKSHQPVMMITDRWIKLEEVQQILENETQEVRALFETDNVASTTMQRIGKEYAELKYLRRSAAAALAWPRTQHERSRNLSQQLQGFRDQLDTRLTQVENFNEADCRARESEILRGNFSWFKANETKQQLDACMKLLPECVQDTECQSETQRCSQESVCVEQDWENLWSRQAYQLATGGFYNSKGGFDRHLYLTHIPVFDKDWGQPLSKMKAKCLEDEKCRAFCNNPDNWSYFYTITNQGTENMGMHGEGWSCFVKPSHSWQALQYSRHRFLANPPGNERATHWQQTFKTAKNLCIEEKCEAFCWNPDDWTYVYPTKPGAWWEACCYGQGWQCFERK